MNGTGTKENVNDDPLYPPPRKILTYPIPSSPTPGSLFLYGRPSAPSLALFCAGFPDDHEPGQAFCSALADRNDTLVGLICLPGYDLHHHHDEQNPDGFTFDEWAGCVREAAKALREESTVEGAKLTGVFHDWGVVAGFVWANRVLEEGDGGDAPDELVMFDVMPDVHGSQRGDVPEHTKATVYENVVTMGYRIVLASAFGLQRYVSKYLGLAVLGLGMGALKALRLSPSLDIDNQLLRSRKKRMDMFRLMYMSYPYYNLLKLVVTGNMRKLGDVTLVKDLKKTPVLYLYGTEKRIMYHGRGAVGYLEREAKERRSKSNAIAIEGAGHWLYISQPEKCLKEVMDFMAK